MQQFQVFLSYKHSDLNGDLTEDSRMAKELYDELKNHNIRVFYANEEIRKLGESDYSRVIDNALEEVNVLVAVGTSFSNLTSNWTQYEWSSFHNDILSGRKERGILLSYISGIHISDLPRVLRQYQTFEKEKSQLSEICSFICNSLKEEQRPIQLSQCRIKSMREIRAMGISSLDAEKAYDENDKNLYAAIPAEISGTPEQWAAIFEKYPDYSAAVIDNENKIWGNYSLVGLTRQQASLMNKGNLADDTVNVDTADHLYRRGKHIGYLLNMSVNPSSESAEAYKMLWDHFIDLLKRMAKEKGVYFTKIYYKAFLPEHEAKMAARGFRYCCRDRYYGNVYVHDMDAESTLNVLDHELADLYAQGLAEYSMSNVSIQELDALTAYMDLWRQIEELFYHPDYCRLKRYFMEGSGIPQNTVEYKKGLAVSEWIRDNLQYSEALLPFIPESMRMTHKQFKEKIYNSEIVRDSMDQYRFSTEDDVVVQRIEGSFSVKALVTYAHIWMDIDRLFMLPELLDYKKYFYEATDELPDEKDLELCQMLAVRIMSVFKVSEDLQKQLPIVFAESYYRYKAMVCSSALAKSTFSKFPYLKYELHV